mgnify:CR=1 FL=1
MFHSVEKLQEAEYFLAGMTRTNGLEYKFNLNAFLSASRSVTFVLQKSMSNVSGFDDWYRNRRTEMRADSAMAFFVELRNISSHEGPVSMVGASLPEPPYWTYRFAGNREAVPNVLIGQDVAKSCAAYLTKLAKLLQEFAAAFPYDCCITSALTPDGIRVLRYSLEDVCGVLGLPSGFLEAGEDIPLVDKLRLLAKEFDPIDMTVVETIAAGQFANSGETLTFSDTHGSDLTDDIAKLIETRDPIASNLRMAFLSVIGKRIQDIEDG